MFPNLYREVVDRLIPNVFDHLEVCGSLEEAIEIINYFERIGELSKEYASFLKDNPILLQSMIKKRKRGEYESRGLL